MDDDDDVKEIHLAEEQRAYIRGLSQRVLVDHAHRKERGENEEAIGRLYNAIGLRKPLFFYADNPRQLMLMAFLLQTVASVPHGVRRKKLLQGRVPVAPADVAWKLSESMDETWRIALAKLTEQLEPIAYDRLCDDSHHDCARVSRYHQPDLLTTCESRLGFPCSPALTALYEEIKSYCMGHVWQRYSSVIAREFVTLVQEHYAQNLWHQRTRMEIAIVERDPLTMRTLIPGFVRDFERQTRSSPLPLYSRIALTENLSDDLLHEVLLLQDTRCHHERVEGTSALKPTSHSHQHSSNRHEHLFELCCNHIYQMNWGTWLREELSIWKSAETIYDTTIFPQRVARLVDDFLTMKDSAFAYIFGSRVVLVSDNPNRIDWNERTELHSWNQPAIEFPDGSQWHFWRGMYITPEWCEQYKKTSVKAIDKETNVELRRVLIERYGAAKYLRDSGAKVVDKDQFGTLYRKNQPDDEPLCMVKVRNSTPEPDGTYKDYYLRVPPHIETARAAVAWTFGLWHGHYEPNSET